MKKLISQYELDMTSGPILKNMIRFSIPLMFSTVLQLLYNAADMVVVGRFAGSTALAAVGATGAITSLLVNLFMGLSVGASVTVAQHCGANRQEDISQSVHTAVTLAALGGIVIGFLGIILARPLLAAMDTPSDVLDQAVVYMAIYFAGMPANLLYNFCAAILSAVGDTRRPLLYLSISGVVNVILNLIFVIVFKMGVSGVALATIISQAVSMILVIRCLIRFDGSIRLELRKLRLYRDKVLQIVRIGLPAGLQSSMFSISNTIIQSSINGFGAAAIAGNTAAANIESFVSTPLCSFYQAAMSFASQNYGARKVDRIGRIAGCGAGLIAGLGVVLGLIVALFSRPLLGIYTSDAAVIEWGMTRMWMLVTTCFIADSGEVFVSCMRAMGNSVQPMILSVLCTCVFRVAWIYTVFAVNPTIITLYLVYPISWTLATTVHFICFMRHKRKVMNRMKAEEQSSPEWM